MSFSEKCRECSVIVDNGTGVFFQPDTDEYSYILTAKHNLYKNYENKKCLEPKKINDIQLIAYNENIDLSIIDKYELDDCSIDIAILKIKKVNKIYSPHLIGDGVRVNNECFLYGFPKNRRDKKHSREEQIRNFKLEVVDKFSNNEIIVENDKYYPQEDIDGCSGGGVFKNIDNEPYLVGIEFRMDSVGNKDSNNTRLRFFSIKAFNKIDNELEYSSSFKKKEKMLSINSICLEINKILVHNFLIWKTFGPESEEAQKNPLSNAVDRWESEKLKTIVPNNKKIIALIENNIDKFQVDEYEACFEFIEHAKGFEENCSLFKKEGVKRFPKKFSEVIDKYVK